MSYLLINGVNLYYEYIESQQESEETIVFLHGNGFDSSIWGQMATDLNNTYHLLLVDLRGCGKSEASLLGKVSWELFCEDLYELTQKLGIQSFYLLGHAFGSSLAIVFADQYPKLVNGLILLSVNILFPEKEGETIIQNYISLIEEHGFPYILDNYLVPSLTLFQRENEQFQKLYHMYLHCSIDHYLVLFRLLNQNRPISELSDIQCPTLLLAGERDSIYLPSFQSMTADRIRNATYYVVPKASNALFMDQPQVTSMWIKSFLENIRHHTEVRQLFSETRISNSIQSTLHTVVQTIFQEKGDKTFVLRVDLLYGFRVCYNGQDQLVGWNKRYAKNILAYMAIHPFCTREELCDAIFPHISLQVALKNIKVYMNYLKSMLTHDGIPFLKTDRQHLLLQCRIESDLIELKDQLKWIARSEENEKEKYRRCKQLFDAMYDKNIIPGMYDPWILEEKTNIEYKLATLALWMTRQEVKKGNSIEAEGYRKLVAYYLKSDEEA